MVFEAVRQAKLGACGSVHYWLSPPSSDLIRHRDSHPPTPRQSDCKPAFHLSRRCFAIHPQESAVRRATLACMGRMANTATRALPSARWEVGMPKMSKRWMSLCLALGMIAGAMPSQASEVVKLARLVVSGKRNPADVSKPAPAEARSPAAGSQVHGSGGSNDAGTAPAPPRGVS